MIDCNEVIRCYCANETLCLRVTFCSIKHTHSMASVPLPRHQKQKRIGPGNSVTKEVYVAYDNHDVAEKLNFSFLTKFNDSTYRGSSPKRQFHNNAKRVRTFQLQFSSHTVEPRYNAAITARMTTKYAHRVARSARCTSR